MRLVTVYLFIGNERHEAAQMLSLHLLDYNTKGPEVTLLVSHADVNNYSINSTYVCDNTKEKDRFICCHEEPMVNRNLHIDLEFPLKAALIFPRPQGPVCCSWCTLKMNLFDFICKICNGQIERNLRNEGDKTGRGDFRVWAALLRVWGICLYDGVHVCMCGSKWQNHNTVGVFFLFFLSGNQSVQRSWAPGEPTRHVDRCFLSWGQDRESSDFSGATTRHGKGRRNFLQKKVERGNRGNHPSKADLKWKYWWVLQSSPQSWQVYQT